MKTVAMNKPSDRDEQQLDQALTRLADFGPEYRGGLANHGPMAVGALCRLGRAHAIQAWTDRYCSKLEPAISMSSHAPVLGEFEHFPRWFHLFERSLAACTDWRDLVASWSTQLAPGLFGAAGHGLLRCAYAVRALGRRDNPTRRRELAAGLAYWAARYRPLPGHARASGQRALREVLCELPAVTLDEGWLIVDRLQSLDREPGVSRLLSEVRPSELSAANLTSALAPWAHAGARIDPIAHVHVLTIPVAAMELSAFLPDPRRSSLLDYALHASIGLLVGWRPAAPVVCGPESIDIEALIDAAVESGDEHAIKVVDACLLAFEHARDPALLHASRELCRCAARS